ncbi:MAG TPA: DUF87 domain-containing protein, partial [Verrucomicrobiales bacterium]|nr:DUF87 domain-containing protein [Verrucomicrobiales bacterium]
MSILEIINIIWIRPVSNPTAHPCRKRFDPHLGKKLLVAGANYNEKNKKDSVKKIKLGSTQDSILELKLETLQRHFACFGSSGSGKTVASKVLLEELARNGVP